MKEFSAKVVEEWAYKAYHKGFFPEWQKMTSSIAKEENIAFDDAAEKAYKTLKLMGSE